MKTVVVIPTYNERENIPSLVERILSIATARLDLFFIDDGSPDGTGQLLNTLSAMKPRVRVLHRVLADMHPTEEMELLTTRLRKTKSNAEFLMTMNMS